MGICIQQQRKAFLVGIGGLVVFSSVWDASLVSTLFSASSFHDRIRFVPIDENDDSVHHQRTQLPHCDIDYEGIALRRRLQHPQQAVTFLRRIVEEPAVPRFDHENDLFVFEHTMKTGGTSFSNKLSQMFGSEAVVPGSRPSGWFKKDELSERVAALRGTDEANDDEHKRLDAWWRTQRVMYSHSHLQDDVEDGNGNFERWFLAQMMPVDHPHDDDRRARKRVRLGTLYRHPLEWLGSNHMEWMCRLRGRMEATWEESHPGRAPPRRGPLGDPDCLGLNNLTALANTWLHGTLPEKCHGGDDRKKPRECRQYRSTGQDPTPHCRSATDLVGSQIFQKMNRYPQYLIPKDGRNESLSALEERAFQRYGGFVPAHNVSVAWLGLTERYDESLILFYEWLGWAPDASVGRERKERYKTCRPTSFWPARDQQMLSRALTRSFVVHNVANAILDVRMAAWCCRRQRRQQEVEENNLPHAERAAVQRFCLGDDDGDTKEPVAL